jgi:hypothetical protein
LGDSDDMLANDESSESEVDNGDPDYLPPTGEVYEDLDEHYNSGAGTAGGWGVWDSRVELDS